MEEPPKVFISYSHDSAAHKLQVLELANSLRHDGIDARLDRYTPFPAEGWPRWIERQIAEADAIIVVCTHQYKERFLGTGQPRGGGGARWEGLILSQAIYENPTPNSARIIPVLLGDASLTCIPTVLRPFSYFPIPEKYEALLRVLTNQPEIEAPKVGILARLPAQTTTHITRSLPVRSPGATENSESLQIGTREGAAAGQVLPWAKKNQQALEVLRERWTSRRMTVIVGQGVSIGSGLPPWNSLIHTLVASYVGRTYAGKMDGGLVKEIKEALVNQFQSTAPVHVAGFIRSRLSNEDFIRTMRDALYGRMNDGTGNHLLSAVASLSAGLHGVVTYSFDDLVEEALNRAGVEFTSVLEDRDLGKIRGLPIYHPHGYIPRSGNPSSNIVFGGVEHADDQARHGSWPEIVVRRLLLESTCLFVGISLSEPSLQRMIEVVHRHHRAQQHFLLTLAPRHSTEDVSQALAEVQDASYQAIGVTPVWFDSFEDVPKILDSIRR